MIKPDPTSGLRHVALFVSDLEACEKFYVDLLGMAVEAAGMGCLKINFIHF